MMKFYRIRTKNDSWGLVNLRRVIVVEFVEEAEEIVFDEIIRFKVDGKDYKALRKDILKKMFRRL